MIITEAEYDLLLGWSWEQIEAQGLTDEFKKLLWCHLHPTLWAFFSAACLVGAAMLPKSRF